MISAIVLAAGLSTRMGTQKLLLPWGDTTVIGNVIRTVFQGGIADIRVVTGGNHESLKALLVDERLQLVFNKEYANGEMLTSIKVGLEHIRVGCEAILVVLGDQPQIEAVVVQKIVDRFKATHHQIIVPSYKMHRGHPWLLGNQYWPEINQLEPPQTLRDFLIRCHEIIDYLVVDTPSVIQDLDTLDDYTQFKP